MHGTQPPLPTNGERGKKKPNARDESRILLRERAIVSRKTNRKMSAFVMSASARAAPARLGKVGGLGFRQAVAAVRVPVQPKAPVAPRAVAMVTVAGKPGAKAKTRKAAAKRFKITASGKVSAVPMAPVALVTDAAAGRDNPRSGMLKRPHLRRKMTRLYFHFSPSRVGRIRTFPCE